MESTVLTFIELIFLNIIFVLCCATFINTFTFQKTKATRQLLNIQSLQLILAGELF